ncbi:hypothetical protein F2Q70_00010741 [Brassica cretica]|uniref:Uncharacterized protein n=1 Tax=Brassica cretica TaxID=69181 RepID=A0A8S9M388_BRACR|nr:hypothetical protein F2Q70_00010741 [Brassica cretica]
MFLNTTGYSNLGSLAELVKDDSAANASSDMQQMVNPQSLQQQQLLERMRKRQVTSPRPNMDMEKDRPLVQEWE